MGVVGVVVLQSLLMVQTCSKTMRQSDNNAIRKKQNRLTVEELKSRNEEKKCTLTCLVERQDDDGGRFPVL